MKPGGGWTNANDSLHLPLSRGVFGGNVSPSKVIIYHGSLHISTFSDHNYYPLSKMMMSGGLFAPQKSQTAPGLSINTNSANAL